MHEVFFISSVEHLSYVGIFIFTVVSGSLMLIPEEVLLIVVGYMASSGLISLFPAIFVVIAGIIISDNILFKLTTKNNKHVTKFIHEVLSFKIITKNRDLFEKHISLVIFLSRFIPFLRFVGPVFAGYVKAKEKTFMLFNTLAVVIYTPFLIWIGYFFHDNFDQIISQIGRVNHSAVIFLWIIIGFIITRIVDYSFGESV